MLSKMLTPDEEPMLQRLEPQGKNPWISFFKDYLLNKDADGDLASIQVRTGANLCELSMYRLNRWENLRSK